MASVVALSPTLIPLSQSNQTELELRFSWSASLNCRKQLLSNLLMLVSVDLPACISEAAASVYNSTLRMFRAKTNANLFMFVLFNLFVY
ncbi:hypothetical protein AQUCO_03800123v1 [Aquilegia coerulea]|uniref:Uncharacterized protein n=1 Tax=Aquilegia coerulea TaxID=218851 RepID=A0A2G5CSS1_AQUCA|nr:hypothetical protein AQUCO_03800123v1 [Aquilegia coerulea]